MNGIWRGVRGRGGTNPGWGQGFKMSRRREGAGWGQGFKMSRRREGAGWVGASF